MSNTVSSATCPILVRDLVPDHGRVSEYGGFSYDEYNNRFYQYEVGEIFDVCCVAENTKPLAAMDLTESGVESIRKCLDIDYYDKQMYVKVLHYLNNVGIRSFQWTGPKGNYLKCVYYNPKMKRSRDNALKLQLVLHTNYYEKNINKTLASIKFHIRVGHLLGYPVNRIAGYIIRNIEYREVLDDLKAFIGKEIKQVDCWELLNEHDILAEYPIKHMIGVETSSQILKGFE